MTLNKLIEKLQKLQSEGHGELTVFTRHGASGACDEIGSPHVTDQVDDMGPFDVDGKYISIYVGN